MVELKTRSTKCERYEAGDGHLCGIAPVIIAAAIGAGASYLSSRNQAKGQADANDDNAAMYDAYLDANKNAGMPIWSDEQQPYVFGDRVYNPIMPEVNPDAQAWGYTAAGGGVPGVPRLEGPMSLSQIRGQLPGGNNGQFGQDIQNLLGFGRTAPPPLFLDPTTGKPGLMNNRNPMANANPPPAAIGPQGPPQGGPDPRMGHRGDFGFSDPYEFARRQEYAARQSNPYGGMG